MARTWTDEQLLVAVSTNTSIAGVIRSLGLKSKGANYGTVSKRISDLGIDASHMQWKSRNTKGTSRNRYSLEEILVENSPYVNSNDLKQRLIREGILEEVCTSCTLTEWMGQPIPLELDHINGVRTDNRIENLRIICPNCHALTPTYRGRSNRKSN